MSAEVACTVVARAGGTVLKKLGTSLQLVVQEPCPWTINLDNSAKDYNPDAAIANPRTFADVLNIDYKSPDGSQTWTSPDLVVEDYDYDTHQVTITGRCRLSQLDRDDQWIDAGDGTATFEDTTVSSLLAAIAAPYGLSVSGAPSRSVKRFTAVGNPLQMFRDLLEPTHVFRMGSGTTIVVESITSNANGPTYTDSDHLELVRFKRTSEIFNRATVERVTGTSGRVVLVDDERSGGDTLAGVQTVTLSSPSRLFTIVQAFGKRGIIDSVILRDEGGSSVGAVPYIQGAYSGVTPVASIDFQYNLKSPEVNDHGPWTPFWYWRIEGYPETAVPPETAEYSKTSTVGAGDRPYPEPFTSLAIENGSDAQAAADAFTTIGTRQGNILNAATRLDPTKIPWPNNELTITDFLSGLSGDWIAESVGLDESEDGDTGTISLEATRSEES